MQIVNDRLTVYRLILQNSTVILWIAQNTQEVKSILAAVLHYFLIYANANETLLQEYQYNFML
jgi:hypothetical protein